MNSTNLLSSIVEHKEPSRDGFTVTRFSPGGDPEAAAIVNAVVDVFRREVKGAWEALEGRASWSRSDAAKVTVIMHGKTMLGAPGIFAVEGRVFDTPGGLALLPKGARKNGRLLNRDRLLSFLDGWDVDEAKRFVDAIRGRFPTLRPLTQERLMQLPAPSRLGSGVCSLAVFGTYPLPDCVSYDAIWLCGEYDAEGDVVDGCVLLIRPEHGVSEHGSQYGRTFLRLPVGEIVGFEPIRFADALELTNLPYNEAAAAVFARAKP